MTFALGRRFIVVDGVERWKDRELEPLEAALAAIGPDTTVAFFAREDGRLRAPARLHEAVRNAGGDISAEASVKPWELPKWVVARGRELELSLDTEAARALIRQVGDRQQRLLRELEKLALRFGSGASVTAENIEDVSSPSAERRAWTLADTLVAGDTRAAVRTYLRLRSQGERVSGLVYWMAQRVRTAHEITHAADAGEPPAQIKRKLRMPSRAADALIADAQRSGSDKLRLALQEIADLELASRGGGPGAASEDTAVVSSIRRMAG
jgi:DNA polymerase-3 subunit delta